jgi:hypothetical protein
MKKSKNNLSTILSGGALMALIGLSVGGYFFGEHSIAALADNPVTWNHYAALAPSVGNPGCKEYWVSCADHSHQFTAPSTGTVVDAGTPSSDFAAALASDDDRYVDPSLVTTIASLSDAMIQGGPIERAYSAYEGLSDKTHITNASTLTSVKSSWENKYGLLFDGGNATQNSGWKFQEYNCNAGYVATTAFDATYGDYLQLDNVVTSADNFSLGPVTQPTVTGYDYWAFHIYNPTSTTQAFTLYDSWTSLTTRTLAANSWNDFEISAPTIGGTTTTELRFNVWTGTANTNLGSGWKFTSLYGVKTAGVSNFAAAIDTSHYGNGSGNLATFFTKQSYDNIEYVKLSYKIDGTIPSSKWWGLRLGESSAPTVYSAGTTINQWHSIGATSAADWVTAEWNPDKVSEVYPTGSISLAFDPGDGSSSATIYLDSFVIIYHQGGATSGTTVTESFNGGVSTLFNMGEDCSIHAFLS